MTDISEIVRELRQEMSQPQHRLKNLAVLVKAADALERLSAGSREGALRTLAALFAESVHETYTREEVVSIIEDALALGRPAGESQ